jgi:hypothetical protein
MSPIPHWSCEIKPSLPQWKLRVIQKPSYRTESCELLHRTESCELTSTRNKLCKDAKNTHRESAEKPRFIFDAWRDVNLSAQTWHLIVRDWKELFHLFKDFWVLMIQSRVRLLRSSRLPRLFISLESWLRSRQSRHRNCPHKLQNPIRPVGQSMLVHVIDLATQC